MLKSLHIDGLKSLKDFKLELKPGLNVLVGPNGSGKSNILTAFELLSNLSNIEIVNSRGYVGAIEIAKLFDKFDRKKEISIAVSGDIDTRLELESVGNGKFNDDVNLCYEYHCVLKYQPDLKNKLYFSKQHMDLRIQNINNDTAYDIVVEYQNSKTKVTKYSGLFLNKIENDIIKNAKNNEGKLNFNLNEVVCDIFESNFEEENTTRKFRSLIYELGQIFDPVRTLMQELESGKTYDIDPKEIRSNICELDYPAVGHDGSGLLSALLNICENKNGNKTLTFKNNNPVYDSKETYDAILAYLREMLPEAKKLNVEFQKDKQEIYGAVTFGFENDNEKALEIEYLSDGTLKWLALVTILLTNDKLFILEVPENFLHPTMQGHMIDLMTESIECRDQIRLFSTHCSTILNMVKPEDVILTYYRNGKTLVKRIEDPVGLSAAIRDTGFGIGWHLETGAFDYENLI